jgi:hypothetical protein
MAKKRKAAPELPPEARAANAARDATREKEQQARIKNAEKQKRFRNNMKEAGHKRVTLYDDPAPAGQHKRMAGMGFKQVPAWEIPQKNTSSQYRSRIRVAVRIRETSLNAAARFPEVQKAITAAAGEFYKALEKFPERNPVLLDYMELLKVIGDPWKENK